MCPYRISDDGIISSYFEASLMQFMYCRNAASFWWEKKQTWITIFGQNDSKKKKEE